MKLIKTIGNILIRILVLFILAIFFINAYYLLQIYLGYNTRPVPVLGTGSMYPTFPKSHEIEKIKQYEDIIGTYDFTPYPNGLLIFGKRYFNYNLQRGDIVVAENKKIFDYTKDLHSTPSGVIKRIIAMPGDSLEIRGGLVYLNNKPLIEPYIARAHSTFGESFLSECKKIIIPSNKIFLMGDNRKGSGDSREFGLVDVGDIKAVISIEKQKGKLDIHYRITANDLSEATKIKVDKQQYLDLLNKKRNEVGAQPLTFQNLLEESAKIRGQTILKYNDFSFEATRSGVNMKKAMTEVDYYNIVYGEAPTQGYYDAEELVENQFEYADSKEFLLNQDYQEIGIAEVEGVINGCPTQIIIQHFAGYVPPNYNQGVIDSWKKALDNLKSIQSNWQKLKEYSDFYSKNKSDVDRINEIISIRINKISPIIKKMDANIWMNSEETQYTYADKILADEQNQLAEKLNNQ